MNQREKWSAEQQGSFLAAPASGTLQFQRQGNNQEGEGATGQGWLERNADEESAPSSYLSRVTSSFNYNVPSK